MGKIKSWIRNNWANTLIGILIFGPLVLLLFFALIASINNSILNDAAEYTVTYNNVVYEDCTYLKFDRNSVTFKQGTNEFKFSGDYIIERKVPEDDDI